MKPSRLIVGFFITVCVLIGGAKHILERTPSVAGNDYVLVRTRTNATWNATAPANARRIVRWELRGAHEDAMVIVLGSRRYKVYSNGRLIDFTSRDTWSLGADLSLLPEANWHLLPEGAASRFWFMETPDGSHLFTWENAARNRHATDPVSVQLELTFDGDAYLRHSDGWEKFFYRRRPEDAVDDDRDGDGLTTLAELTEYLTDPGVADSDGDGIPDGEEVIFQTNPLARDLPDAFILANLSAASTNETIKLFNGFAVDTAEGILYEKTIETDPSDPWVNYYVTAAEEGWKRFHLKNLALEQITSNDTVTIRLVATDSSVACRVPLYLVPFAPKLEISGTTDVEPQTRSLERYTVHTGEFPARLSVTIDWTGRPAEGELDASERRLAGLRELEIMTEGACHYEGDEHTGTIVVERPGVYPLPGTKTPRWLVAMEPRLSYGGLHEYTDIAVGYDPDVERYAVTRSWPVNSRCVYTNWIERAIGAAAHEGRCVCEPSLSIGFDPAAYSFLAAEATAANEVAQGTIRVAGTTVWSGTAPHRPEYGPQGGNTMSATQLTDFESCQDCFVLENGCENGMCDEFEGTRVDSLKFRVPLGSPEPGQISGFIFFSMDEPVAITTNVFELVERSTNEVHQYSAVLSPLTTTTGDTGVTLTLTNNVESRLEHTWEIANVSNDINTVRFRKISRQLNTMEDKTASYSDGTWRLADNVSGLTEELTRDDRLNDDGTIDEWRTKSVNGRQLSYVHTRSELIGRREAAVLRETVWEEWTGRQWKTRYAEYWNDPLHPRRHGQLKKVWGTACDWEYREYDEEGRPTDTYYQKDGSAAFDLSNAYHRVYTNPVPQPSAVPPPVSGAATPSLTSLQEPTTNNQPLTTRLYDHKHRLISEIYDDGTWTTNVYSCCRLLWTRDREGKRRLRSAVTGEDRLYYAIEEAWEVDEGAANGHHVTQHFFDALGRETNTTVYIARELGEATNKFAAVGKEIVSVHQTLYPTGGDDDVIYISANGERTYVSETYFEDRLVTEERRYADSTATEPMYWETSTIYNGGRSEVSSSVDVEPEATTSTAAARASVVDKNYTIMHLPELFYLNNWPVAGALMTNWILGDANQDETQNPQNTTDVTMAWILSFERARAKFDSIFSFGKYRSTATKKEFRNTIIKWNPQDGRFSDLTQYVPNLHFQHANKELVASSSLTDRDDLVVALGNFHFHIALSGQIEGGCIVVDQVGVYARDVFEFNGWQPLGWWDVINMTGPDAFNGIYLENRDFRIFKETGRGGDYEIFSDVKIVSVPKFIIVIHW